MPSPSGPTRTARTLALLGLPLLALTARAREVDPVAAQDEPVGPIVEAADTCALCHSLSPNAGAMRDAEGRGIAQFDLWRSSMMANAARDPLWRAVVSAEVAATPSRRVEIETKCLSCHAPMAHQVGLEEHGTGSLMHVLDCESPLGEVARDGVSCTICHGILPDGLGTDASFTAGFRLDPEKRLFGPHPEPFEMPMRGHTWFVPAHSDHVRDSALCGSCHTLETTTFDPEGRETGHTLVEQAPYLEWRNSRYSDEVEEPGPLAATCQDCHVPTTDVDGREIRTRLAHNPGGFDFGTPERSPYGRHLFVGGNTLVLGMFRDHAEELAVRAPREALEATLAATREQLATNTADLVLRHVERDAGRLAFDVRVVNRTGHKFPTGHPTRRAWLRVEVRDAAGALRFASGVPDATGRLLGPDGEVLPSELAGGPVPGHVTRVTSADQVARFEAVMADAAGAPTFTLLRGARWLHDSRLLPAGWDPQHAEARRTWPVGTEDDPDFGGGGDTVRYELELEAEGELTIEVALCYQTLSARWEAELMRWDTPEVARLKRLLATAPVRHEVVATARAVR